VGGVAQRRKLRAIVVFRSYVTEIGCGRDDSTHTGKLLQMWHDPWHHDPPNRTFEPPTTKNNCPSHSHPPGKVAVVFQWGRYRTPQRRARSRFGNVGMKNAPRRKECVWGSCSGDHGGTLELVGDELDPGGTQGAWGRGLVRRSTHHSRSCFGVTD